MPNKLKELYVSYDRTDGPTLIIEKLKIYTLQWQQSIFKVYYVHRTTNTKGSDLDKGDISLTILGWMSGISSLTSTIHILLKILI